MAKDLLSSTKKNKSTGTLASLAETAKGWLKPIQPAGRPSINRASQRQLEELGDWVAPDPFEPKKPKKKKNEEDE